MKDNLVAAMDNILVHEPRNFQVLYISPRHKILDQLNDEAIGYALKNRITRLSVNDTKDDD